MLSMASGESLSRANIQSVTEEAFRRFESKVSSFPVLSPFDLSLEEFKREGLRVFGEERFGRLADAIELAASQIQDQILVIGWGHAPASVMVYEISAAGGRSDEQLGSAAIGSGGQVALSNLLLLGQSRDSTLADTIYNVAAAKFSAVHSNGLFVGRHTSIHISRKRTEEDTDKTVGVLLPEQDVESLRKIWEEHGRPRIPGAAITATVEMVSRLTGSVSVREMIAVIGARMGPGGVGEEKHPATPPTSHSSGDQQ
jgi:hypothetical protein